MKERRSYRPLSAGTLLTSVFVILAMALAAALLTQFKGAWAGLQLARHTTALAAADRALYQATNTLRLSRGQVLTAFLTLDEPASRLRAFSAENDAALTNTLRQVDASLAQEAASQIADVLDRWQAVGPTSRQLLALTAKPKSHRDVKDGQGWYDAMGLVAMSLSKLSKTIAAEARHADPIIGDFMTARTSAWVIRDDFGLECSNARALFVDNKPMDAATRLSVTRTRASGARSLLWLEEVLARSGASDALVAAMDLAGRTVSKGFADRDAAYAALGGPQALDAAAWQEMCVAPFGAILTLADVAIDGLIARAAEIQADAVARLRLIGVAMAVAVAASLGGLFLIRRRVIRPVRLLTTAIARLASRDFVTPVPSLGRQDEFSAMATTLEHLRQSEAETQQVRRRFEQAIDNIAQVIVLFDADDRVVACNRAFLDLHKGPDGVSPAMESIVGLTFRQTLELRIRVGLYDIPDGNVEVFIEDRVERFRVIRSEWTFDLADGRSMQVGNRTMPDCSTIDVWTDITGIKEAELQRRKLEAQLHHSQRLEALGTLAGGIAHDLNNTLVPILGLIDLTAEDLPEGSRERANLEIIADAARRARGLVRQILAFSRKDQGERKVFDFARLVREALVLLRSALPSTIRVEQAIGDMPPMAGDDGQFHQVIVNLITNASQAIGHGIGVITVSLQSLPHLSLIRLSVTDTGCGMDEATRLRVFEPFFTTKAVNEGTGLGLSIIHGIVVAHGGTIRVTSAPGEGTTFEMDLPSAGKDQAGGAAITAAATPAVIAA
jgi:signal transduction histidine kinase/HAMP domain-containing protein